MVLSALAHGRDPQHRKVLDVLADALDEVETPLALMYLRLVLGALPQAARAHLQELMTTGTYEYQSEFTVRLRNEGAAKGHAKGRVEGRAEAKADGVLRVLRARGVEVPDDVGKDRAQHLDVELSRRDAIYSEPQGRRPAASRAALVGTTSVGINAARASNLLGARRVASSTGGG